MAKPKKEDIDQQSKEAAKSIGETEEILLHKEQSKETEEIDWIEIVAQMTDLEYRARILAMLNELVSKQVKNGTKP